jgi:gluconokinase
MDSSRGCGSFVVARFLLKGKDSPMANIIYPRSPREMMDGWVHLPRFIDKIRLHLAGQLHSDYRDNFTKGFDGTWLKAAGVEADKMIEVVRQSITDGQVCDWVRQNVKKTPDEKAAYNTFASTYGTQNEEVKARLAMRKKEGGFGNRDDVLTFFDLIDADEKRI